jgi:steroid 5-alpha reductase family enzyme
MLQMILMLVVALPILVVNLSLFVTPAQAGIHALDFSETDPYRMTKGWIFLSISFLLSVAGLIFETIADLQLREFIKIKKP